ncbi:LAP2 protein, partial [Atractosteus spatula]|nr:LAP2 protein [Atractosteus spatula]
MSEFLEDPSVLTKDKLKSELLANSVPLPSGEQKKDVYVQLYLQHLTAQNKARRNRGAPEAFSSDEELPSAPPVSNRNRSGRKATKKTDKPRPEDVDVAELTDEDLKDQLLKYGVSVGPIVASTRKLYEKKLQKLLDQGPPETLPLPSAPLRAADANQNGNTDSEKYSDNEEDEKLEPIVEKLEPVKTRVKTTPSLRTRRYEHNRKKLSSCVLESETTVFLEKPLDKTLGLSLTSAGDRVTAAPNPSPVCGPPSSISKRLDDRPLLLPAVLPSPLETQRSSKEQRKRLVVPALCNTSNSHTCASLSFTVTCICEGQGLFQAEKKRNNVSAMEPSPGGSTKPLFPLLPHSECPSRQPAAGRPETERKVGSGHCGEPLDMDPLLPAPVPGCGHTWMSVPRCMRDIAHGARVSSPRLSPSSPLLSHSRLPPLSPQVEERLEAGDVVRRKEAKDLLEEMFPYEPRTPTGITATCRRPIHGAAGRPLNPSDFRLDDSILRRTEFTETSLTAPSGGQSRSRRSLPVWLQLLLLMAVAGFLFFVYQAMETNEINPFSTMVSPASPSSAEKPGGQ